VTQQHDRLCGISNHCVADEVLCTSGREWSQTDERYIVEFGDPRGFVDPVPKLIKGVRVIAMITRD
jgi:hypothetical protein